MSIQDHYASAVHATSLRPSGVKGQHEGRHTSNTDVLGAYSWASREVPLAVDLERLFAGDTRAAHGIVRTLTEMLWSKADNLRVKPKLGRSDAHTMACCCLAWHRNGTCTACGGHGYDRIPGTNRLSEHECQACRGTGRMEFDRQFIEPHRELARWLLVEMTRESGRAGPAAMAALSSKLNL